MEATIWVIEVSFVSDGHLFFRLGHLFFRLGLVGKGYRARYACSGGPSPPPRLATLVKLVVSSDECLPSKRFYFFSIYLTPTNIILLEEAYSKIHINLHTNCRSRRQTNVTYGYCTIPNLTGTTSYRCTYSIIAANYAQLRLR